jgi:DNA-binding NarL/FixJ family response regulator
MRILDQFAGRDSRRVFVPDRGFVLLSPRETEVLEMLRQGLATNIIAQRLRVSPVTVRTHVSTALKKLGAKDRTEAIQLFER